MSYAGEVKAELCRVKNICADCHKSMIYGMLIAGRAGSGQAVISTESKSVATFLAQGIAEYTGAIVTIHNPIDFKEGKRVLNTVMVESLTDMQNPISAFFEDGNINKTTIWEQYIEKECCTVALLRGAFCICGTITNPSKEYHLEFSFFDANLCDEFIYLLQSYDLEFKKTMRGKNYIAYIKESQLIEDTLTLFGATKASLQLMNLKIEKELRNKVNRRTNCETANIDKTVNAAVLQIAKLEKLKKLSILETLSPELKEAARLRMKYPEMSLSELCTTSKMPISRSGLNHRLKKLCKIADDI